MQLLATGNGLAQIVNRRNGIFPFIRQSRLIVLIVVQIAIVFPGKGISLPLGEPYRPVRGFQMDPAKPVEGPLWPL